MWLMMLAMVTGVAQAQPVLFNRLNVSDGLSQGSVLAILQDSNGFVWLGTREGLNRYDGYRIKVYKAGNEANTRSLRYDYINALLEDSTGFWVGAVGGLHKYQPRTDDFERVPLLTLSDGMYQKESPSINALYRDGRGTIWVATGMGVYRLTDKEANRFEMLSADGKNPFIHRRVWAFTEDGEGNLWIAADQGLYKLGINRAVGQATFFTVGNGLTIRSVYYDSIHQKLWAGTQQGGLYLFEAGVKGFVPFANAQNGKLLHNSVRALLARKPGELWVGTQEGINILNPSTGAVQSYQNEPNSRRSLSQNSVYSLYKDRSGSVWIGTYFGGANVVYSTNTPFKSKNFGIAGSGLSNNVVSQITQDAQGHLWIGTEGGGLNRWNTQTDEIQWYKYDPIKKNSIGANLVKTVLVDKQQQVWVGTSTGGLSVLSADRKEWRSIPLPPFANTGIPTIEINMLFEDNAGLIWVGTNFQEIWIYNPDTQQWSNLAPGTQSTLNTRPKVCHQFLQDSRGVVWIATTDGPYLWPGPGKGILSLEQIQGISGKLPATATYSLLEDNMGRIWMGTQKGLALYHPSRQTIETPNITLLNDKVVYGLQEDAQGHLWCSTQKGLIRYNIATKLATLYDTYDGLPDNEFNLRSAHMDNKGTLYFGTYNGLLYFNPAEIEVNTAVGKVAFCNLKLFNNSVEVGDSLGVIKESLVPGSTIYLEHNQNVFSIDYSLLNFIKPYKTRYAHILQGYDKDWIYTREPGVSYGKLPPGTYTLLVKAANNDGVWSEEASALTIIIKKPWWLTDTAIAAYTLLALAGLFFAGRFVWLRARFRRQEAMQQFKLDFFTNLSHEIRTHLTLIAAPVEQVMLQRSTDAALIDQLLPVKANAEKLQTLVREMMDLRRAETNHLQLKIEQFNLPAFLQEVLLSVQSMAEKKNITLLLQCPLLQLPLHFDGIQMEKVFFNLLTNALKFTPPGGTIRLVVQDGPEEVKIRVEDNGVGMDKKTLDRLFTSYFQAHSGQGTDAGYGLGLAMAKSITELHQGRIEVSSIPAQEGNAGNTCFTITLPKGQAHLLQVPQAAAPAVAPPTTAPDADPAAVHPRQLPHLLLAEDNDELRHFLTQSLAGRYTITACANGTEAWEAALQHLPDLLISDVMMPGMSGTDLCRKLKAHEPTNHIPVILLTAKATAQDQVEGLSAGADAYITKPFSVQMLELQIANLTASRAAMRQRYVHRISQPHTPGSPAASTPEEQFLQQVQQLVEQHLEDPNFGVPLLCTQLAMSQTVLYKKLKALTNMSVQDFIRTVRLNKAAQLLREGRLQVGEIAYAVGYSDRKYFSKEFKKQYGKAPSDFASPA